MREVRLLPSVVDDLVQAARWYDDEGSEELGDRFLGVFYSYLAHIQQHNSFNQKHWCLRCCRLVSGL